VHQSRNSHRRLRTNHSNDMERLRPQSRRGRVAMACLVATVFIPAPPLEPTPAAISLWLPAWRDDQVSLLLRRLTPECAALDFGGPCCAESPVIANAPAPMRASQPWS